MAHAKTVRRIRSLQDLRFDERNANKGTNRGRRLIEDSLRNFGAGRSVLVDRRGKLIAGNKTVEAAKKLRKKIRVIVTKGEELVVVQRADLDLKSNTARQLAVADNRASELDLDWNAENLEGVDLSSAGFTKHETENLFKVLEREQKESILDQAIQLKPQREYVVVMCDEENSEWAELRDRLGLGLVRRGGYKTGSDLDHVGTQRVILAKDLLSKLK